MICQKQLVLFNGSFPELCALGLGLWLPKLGCRALGFGFCLEFWDLGFRFTVVGLGSVGFWAGPRLADDGSTVFALRTHRSRGGTVTPSVHGCS